MQVKLHKTEILQTAYLGVVEQVVFGGLSHIQFPTLKHNFQRISYQYSAFLAIHTCSLIYDTLTHRLKS